ncbi:MULTISPECIES: MerR family DNA-binding transcriptional regulator [unclassified Variovorax]|uniref:MerR family DNA-binding transcriptional regulator n=1 Tax=unclassified Variovorax TaxID=663243 RepID=UPI003ED072AF
MDEQIDTLRIGAFAETAGVNVETIRYYQRKGLLPQPEKPYGGAQPTLPANRSGKWDPALLDMPSTEAIHKLLRSTPRRGVHLRAAFDKLEGGTEPPVEFVRHIPGNRQAAALLRPSGPNAPTTATPPSLSA